MTSILGDAPITPEDLFGYLTLNIPIRMETDWYARFRYKYKMDLRGKWLKGQSGIGLAPECEWIMTETAISDGFEKLLYFKAPLKHFIFQTRREVQDLKFRESMQALMDRFAHHVEGEQYVLFEVRGQHAYGYRYEVHSTGKLPPVAFQEINGSPRKWEW